MKAPEFTGYWFDDEDDKPRIAARGDDESPIDEARALDELAERVNAARSVL